ncbi:putative lipid phosphate phosphatase 3, chloroplastic isoform X2 [Salvia splendens]|uniref:putative lipid phosphate phosphatase 3, chloroplastic isoform X2 n=1 Tax=Salvia splendens TaxID=180675 RepID=UPI001C260F81|nr:putative lipid phosphate phosphatase 3, chloroplastic isoform X2 [Salvia splendens]
MGWKISFCPNTNFRTMFQVRPSQFELECRHTIRSHGRQLARDHRFVGEGMMEDLMYPMKENTVPLWAVPLYAVFLPMIVFFLYYLRRNDVYDLHHSVLGLLFSVLITGVLTDAIKDAVGRPRPDFFYRCFPNGRDEYDRWGNVVCHGDPADIKEGHKSFPSGHTSWSFAGLGFLALYLSAKIKCFDRSGHVAKLCIVFLPILVACLVAVSRVDDYWHHWQDVFAGGILGLVVATFCYLQFFPPPYQNEGWGPYAYFRAVEDLRSNPLPQDTTNMLGTNQERASTSVVGSNLDSAFDAMESGRK